MQQERIRKLAASIRALAEKDLRELERAAQIAEARRTAACELHSVCARFAGAINDLVGQAELELDPPHYEPDDFRESGPNLFQLNVRGRIVQVEFAATHQLESTEEFRVPYILEGAVRSFNQPLLDQHLIEEHLLFFCLEPAGRQWRYFDTRTHRTGPLDLEYLTGLMERLV